MSIFVLFQTDKYKTKWTRVFFGVFSSEELALSAAKEEGLISSDSEIDIVQTTLDEFEEL